MNALRVALGIFSGRIIYNFGFQKRLRAFLKPIFTGGVVKANGTCSACFLRKRRRCRDTPSVIAYGDATFPKGTALAVAAKFPVQLKGVPLGELANAVSLRG